MGGSVRRRIRFTEEVQMILYRMGGCTTSQVARWLSLSIEEIEQRDRHSRARRAMIHPQRRSVRVPLAPSYRIATAVLSAMRNAGEVEEIRIRRSHEGFAEIGRLESFYRLSKVKSREAALEAGLVTGVDAEDARPGYARIWSGGAIQHTAHRTDLLATLAEAGRVIEFNGCDVLVESGSAWGESHPDYPLVGARIDKTDAAGGKKYSSVRQKQSGYTGRTYERIVPDGEMVLTILPITDYSTSTDYVSEPSSDFHADSDVENPVDVDTRGVEYA